VLKAGLRRSRHGRKAARAPARCQSASQRALCPVRKPSRPTHPRAQRPSILRHLPGRRPHGMATTQRRPGKGWRRRASPPGGKPGPPRAIRRVVSSRARPRTLSPRGPSPAAFLQPPRPRMERTLPPAGARALSRPGVRGSTPPADRPQDRRGRRPSLMAAPSRATVSPPACGGAARRSASSPRPLRPLPASHAMRLERRVHGPPRPRPATHRPGLLARTPFRLIRRSSGRSRHGPACRSCSATEAGQRLGTVARLFAAAGPGRRPRRKASEASSCRAAPVSCNGSRARRWLRVLIPPPSIPLSLRAPVTLCARLSPEPARRQLSALRTGPPCRRLALLRHPLRRSAAFRSRPGLRAGQERPEVRSGRPRPPAKAPAGPRSKVGRGPTSLQAAVRAPNVRRARTPPSRGLIRPGRAGRQRPPLGRKRRLRRGARRVA